MAAPARANRVYLMPLGAPDDAIRRYRLARLDAVALATPVHGGVAGSGAAAMSPSPPENDRDPRVGDYIAGLPDWQQELCAELRELIHEADPEIAETIKRRVQPYFVLEGNVCALLAAKDHVNLFLYDGAIVPDPEGIITGGHDNKTARTVAFRRGEAINRPALTAMLRQIAANNRAGGWRRLKRE